MKLYTKHQLFRTMLFGILLGAGAATAVIFFTHRNTSVSHSAQTVANGENADSVAETDAVDSLDSSVTIPASAKTKRRVRPTPP